MSTSPIKTSPGRTKRSRAALDRSYRLKKLRKSRAEAHDETDLISVISGDVEPDFNITQPTEEELMTNINNLRAEVNELKIKNQELPIKNSELHKNNSILEEQNQNLKIQNEQLTLSLSDLKFDNFDNLPMHKILHWFRRKIMSTYI